MGRRSLIWKLPFNEFEILVKNSNSIADITRAFGFAVTGRCHKAIKDRIIEEGIDFTHIKLGINSNKGRKFNVKKQPLENLLQENSTFGGKYIKRRVLGAELLENICAICGQEPEWNGQVLVLVLDHTNGVRNDHRIENLRLLCPNCNSQQKTFSGRNKKLILSKQAGTRSAVS